MTRLRPLLSLGSSLLRLNFRTLKTFSVKAISNEWVRKFEANNIPDAESSLKIILSHVMNPSKPELLIIDQEEMNEEQYNFLNNLCECRMARMPVQYIIGNWDFRGLRLKMQPPVFIPRPETEELVDIFKAEVKDPEHILEIGCGSGAISLSLLKEVPKVTCVSIDRTQSAVQLTRENASQLNLLDRLQVVKSCVLEDGQLTKDLPQAFFDGIVSNPPYIKMTDFEKFEDELLYEDLRAVDGGRDGLKVIRGILQFSSRALLDGGKLIMEIDPSQVTGITDFIREKSLPLSLEKVHKDFRKLDRFVSILKIPRDS